MTVYDYRADLFAAEVICNSYITPCWKSTVVLKTIV